MIPFQHGNYNLFVLKIKLTHMYINTYAMYQLRITIEFPHTQPLINLYQMGVRSLFSCGAQGTFLLLLFCSFPLLSLSDSAHENSTKLLSRRLLATTPRNIVKEFLLPHNFERAKLGLPPLRWNKKLADFASSWAHQRQEDCALIHSNSDYGENLFWGSGKGWKPGDAVATWAEEKGYYNYRTNKCAQNKDCLHYTQMVWRESLTVGCARVSCRSGDTFITCNYDPHGNVIGQKPF